MMVLKPGRRAIVSWLGAGITGLIFVSARAPGQTPSINPIASTILEVERRLKARLGVMIKDLQTGSIWQHRANERFPLCSTFKAIAGAAVLARVDQGKEDLSRRVILQPSDLVTYSPVTKDRVGHQGITIGELCEAAITASDNTAGNQILKAIGGPEGLTTFVRSIGDLVTRLDRWEPDLNEASPGDPRDTTTPAAMTATMQKLALGDVLSTTSRNQLVAWLAANKVGGAKIRAGLPREWRVADKTGGGGHGTNKRRCRGLAAEPQAYRHHHLHHRNRCLF